MRAVAARIEKVGARPYFTPALFAFLRQLRRNNDRAWFKENKQRYIEVVRDPFLRFISDFGTHLYRISPYFLADPRPTGGSLFRIYRDTRFSRDKSPYKTHAAAQFRHTQGRDVHAPGFYVHLEPGLVFAGGGLWRPDTKSLAKVREAIAGERTRWKRILSGKEFRRDFRLEGQSLKRPPQGYDRDDPLIEHLQRKDFVAVTYTSEEAACSPDFLPWFVQACHTLAPFMRFLTEALELPW